MDFESDNKEDPKKTYTLSTQGTTKKAKVDEFDDLFNDDNKDDGLPF